MEAFLTIPVVTIPIISNPAALGASFAVSGVLAPALLQEPTTSQVELFTSVSNSLKLRAFDTLAGEDTCLEEDENEDATVSTPSDEDKDESIQDPVVIQTAAGGHGTEDDNSKDTARNIEDNLPSPDSDESSDFAKKTWPQLMILGCGETKAYGGWYWE